MNIGARNSENRQYNLSDMRKDARPSKATDTLARSVERQTVEALEWCEERGAAGDNAPYDALARLLEAARGNKALSTRGLEAACDVLSGRMHPTARDVCSAPAKHLIYNLCGKRAYNYRTDN